MPYLIESDQVIDLLADDPATAALIKVLTEDGASISVITYMEVLEGLLRWPDPALAQATFARFLESVPVLQFSVDEARRCAELRVSLRSRGKRIRPRALDLITAAIALENGLTLVTRNTHDFDDIPGLLLYSWTAPP